MARRPSLIGDDLLRQLMAAGQTDLLIGLPTLNNAATVDPVLAAVHCAVAAGLAQYRVLLLNSDGGSTDGTPDRVREASRSHTATVLASHSLRTMHRIVAPYHGLPGKRAAIRTLFAAADLLQARAVAIVDPATSSPASDALAQLFRLGLDPAHDFVTACPARGPREGLLVTQVVRPMISVAFGSSFEDPVGEEFVASRAFVTDVLRQPVWDDEPLRAGIDLWLRVHALAGPFAAVQLRTPPRPRQTPATPSLRTVVHQVLAALWTCLDLYASQWTGPTSRREPQSLSSPGEAGPHADPPWDGPEMVRACRAAMRDLDPLLRGILSPAVLRELQAAVSGEPLRLGDALWADVLVEYALAWRGGRVRGEELAASFAPLYLGRAVSYLERDGAGENASDRVRPDALERQLLERRSRLVEAWHPAGRGG